MHILWFPTVADDEMEQGLHVFPDLSLNPQAIYELLNIDRLWCISRVPVIGGRHSSPLCPASNIYGGQ